MKERAKRWERARSCGEVAKALGTTRENVFQIERNALEKLKKARALAEFAEPEREGWPR